MRILPTIVFAVLCAAVVSTPAEASRYKGKNTPAVSKATPGKRTFRRLVSNNLKLMQRRIKGSPAPKVERPSERQLAINALGAAPEKIRNVADAKGNPALSRAMKTLRKTFLAIRTEEARLGIKQQRYDMQVRFDNAAMLLSKNGSLLGYLLYMKTDPAGLGWVAEKVYVHPDGKIAGTGSAFGKEPQSRRSRALPILRVPGKLVGPGGVFEYGKRTAYSRTAIEAVEERLSRQ